MGLIVEVYRTAEFGDCTNHGISGRFSRLCLVNVPGPFNPWHDCPAAKLVKNTQGTVKIVPPDFGESGIWYAMGGNYGGTSDARFCQAVEALTGHRFYGAVPIHDRAGW